MIVRAGLLASHQIGSRKLQTNAGLSRVFVQNQPETCDRSVCIAGLDSDVASQKSLLYPHFGNLSQCLDHRQRCLILLGMDQGFGFGEKLLGRYPNMALASIVAGRLNDSGDVCCRAGCKWQVGAGRCRVRCHGDNERRNCGFDQFGGTGHR